MKLFENIRKHPKLNATFVAFILFIQIPHILWGTECISGYELIYNGDPITNFVLYAIDLIEIPGMISYAFIYIAIMTNKTTKCGGCGTGVEKNHKFCFTCGKSL